MITHPMFILGAILAVPIGGYLGYKIGEPFSRDGPHLFRRQVMAFLLVVIAMAVLYVMTH